VVCPLAIIIGGGWLLVLPSAAATFAAAPIAAVAVASHSHLSLLLP